METDKIKVTMPYSVFADMQNNTTQLKGQINRLEAYIKEITSGSPFDRFDCSFRRIRGSRMDCANTNNKSCMCNLGQCPIKSYFK